MPNGIDLWMMTVRCGRCGRPMTLSAFEKREGGWNRYTYDCEQACAPEAGRSVIDIPEHLDFTTRRREEVDYPDPPAGFGEEEPAAEDLENPSQGLFIADPPKGDGTA